MFVGERINNLLEERGITKVKLYTTLGISAPGLDKGGFYQFHFLFLA